MKKILTGMTGLALAVLSFTGMAEEAYLLAAAFACGELLTLFSADMVRAGCAMEMDEDAAKSKQADAYVLMCAGAALLIGAGAALQRFGLMTLPGDLLNCAAGWLIVRTLFEMLRHTGAKLPADIMAVTYPAAVLLSRFSPLGYFRTLTAVSMVLCLAVLPGTRVFDLKAPRFALLKELPSALCAGGWKLPAVLFMIVLKTYGGANEAGAFGLAMLTHALLFSEDDIRGAERERFGTRWIIGAVLTALCVLTGGNGAFCVLAACLAMFASAGMNGKDAVCLLLTAASAACGLFGYPLRLCALLPLPVLLVVLKAELYAAWLPLRARLIRKKLL